MLHNCIVYETDCNNTHTHTKAATMDTICTGSFNSSFYTVCFVRIKTCLPLCPVNPLSFSQTERKPGVLLFCFFVFVFFTFVFSMKLLNDSESNPDVKSWSKYTELSPACFPKLEGWVLWRNWMAWSLWSTWGFWEEYVCNVPLKM